MLRDGPSRIADAVADTSPGQLQASRGATDAVSIE